MRPGQFDRLGFCRALPRATAWVEAHAFLGTLLQLQQEHHHRQQHGGQLGRRDAVVHRQPRFVNTRRKGLDAKVTGHPKVCQSFHQGQGHPGGHGRTRQRQGNFTDTPRQGRSQQTGGLHQARCPLDQGGAGQQVHIRVERQGEHQRSAPNTAHIGPEATLPTHRFTQKPLARGH